MSPQERKAVGEAIISQLGMLCASLACDPKIDAHLVACARGILDATRELHRALDKLSAPTSPGGR